MKLGARLVTCHQCKQGVLGSINWKCISSLEFLTHSTTIGCNIFICIYILIYLEYSNGGSLVMSKTPCLTVHTQCQCLEAKTYEIILKNYLKVFLTLKNIVEVLRVLSYSINTLVSKYQRKQSGHAWRQGWLQLNCQWFKQCR